jgi:ubiquitin-like modifier-activating enzyme ATG7
MQRDCEFIRILVAPFFSDIAAALTQVLKAYETEGFSMLLKAFNDAKYLETLTGLDKLFQEGEDALNSVDWHEEDEDDDF